MQKKIRTVIEYGALALGAYALLSKVAAPAAAAPAANGLGDPNNIMKVHPGQMHPAHPMWRWFNNQSDANESTFGPNPNWAYSNANYSPYDYPYGGGGGESTFGNNYDYDYEPVTYESPDSLESRAAQNY